MMIWMDEDGEVEHHRALAAWVRRALRKGYSVVMRVKNVTRGR